MGKAPRVGSWEAQPAPLPPQPPAPLGPRVWGAWAPWPSRLPPLEEGQRCPPHPLYKESPRRRRAHNFQREIILPPSRRKRRAPCWSSGLSLLRLSPLPLVRAPPFGALTEERETSQAARRRAAGSPSPAHLLPQLRWIGEEEEVIFHRTCAKPSRYCTCGTRCHAVFVNIKFVAVRDRRDLEVASCSTTSNTFDERSASLRSSHKVCYHSTFH